MLRQLFLIIPLICFISGVNAKQTTIPLEYLNQMPMVQQPVISPDGKHIAVILNQDKNTQVAIFPFNDRRKMDVILQLGAQKYRIDTLNWANNERVLVSVSQPLHLKSASRRLRSTHLYSAKIDGSDVFEIKKKARKQSQMEEYLSSPKLLSLLQNEPDHILVTQNDKRDNYYSSIFKVNVNNGNFEKYIANGKRLVSWGVTVTGDVLLAIGVDASYKVDTQYIYTRKNTESDWQLVKTYEPFQEETFEPVMYEPNSESIIVISDHKLKKDALWRYHIKSGEFELIAQAPDMLDITSAITRVEGNKRLVVGYRYNDNFVQRKYFDEQSNALDIEIAAIFNKKGLQATLYDWNRNKTRYLVYAVSDKSPGKFYTFDNESNKLGLWYPQYPYLEKAELASVTPFEFDARDGMTLHGYLTLPNYVKNPPVVVFPHGGPFARDSQYFDPFVQMFANRGYAVLQVNFRGSTGYGGDYYTAGYYQWGKKMQTDLLDGLDWLKSTNLADTDNACIVGASYGGYAALAAGYQTPDKFKCIVAIAGVADMKKTVSDLKRKGFKSYVENAVTEDEDELKAISPVHFANKFKAPVLLIHGKVDTRVSYRESEAMYAALKDADKDVELKLYQYGTHNLDGAVNRKNAMESIDTFLKKYLR